MRARVQIRLHFFRPSMLERDRQGITVDPDEHNGEYFYSSVYRTSTELQDIQIALLQEMLDLVDRCQEHKRAHPCTCTVGN